MKCASPVLLVGIALFVPPFLLLHATISDLFPSGQVGPCSVPVCLLFVPGEFTMVLGLGFSAIRVFELLAEKRARADQTGLSDRQSQ